MSEEIAHLDAERELFLMEKRCKALEKELRSFTEAARSWHQCHHTSAEIQCDWFCECMLRAEPLLKGLVG